MASPGEGKGGKGPDVEGSIPEHLDETAHQQERALKAYRCPVHGEPLGDLHVVAEGGRARFTCTPCCDVARKGAAATFDKA